MPDNSNSEEFHMFPSDGIATAKIFHKIKATTLLEHIEVTFLLDYIDF